MTSVRAALSYAALSCAALSYAAVLTGCGAEEQPRTLEVGVAVPFAGSGLMADAARAWNLVVDEVNDRGGAGGRTLRVHQRDTPLTDTSDLSPVADGFIDLAEEGYKYIISLVSGAAVTPIVDSALPHGVLAMSVTSEERADELPERDGMLLRGILSTDRLIAVQARALMERGLARMTIVGETRGGTADARQVAMADAYRECPTCAVGAVTFPAEADLYRYDWRALGDEVLGAEPDVIFLASANPPALVDAVHSIERAGYSGLYYFAYGALMTAVRAVLGGDAALRFRSHDLALPPSEHLDRFLSLYEAAHGEPFVPEPRLIAFADYLSLLSLAVSQVGDADPHRVSAAMKRIAGPPGEAFGTLDYGAALDALSRGQDIDFSGLSGPLDFDEQGEVSEGFIQEYGLDAAGNVVPVP